MVILFIDFYYGRILSGLHLSEKEQINNFYPSPSGIQNSLLFVSKQIFMLQFLSILPPCFLYHKTGWHFTLPYGTDVQSFMKQIGSSQRAISVIFILFDYSIPLHFPKLVLPLFHCKYIHLSKGVFSNFLSCTIPSTI